jgi:hypothetical protein
MSWGQLMLYVAFAVVAAVVVLAAAGPSVREWRRNASLRREMRTQPIVFRTEVRQVRFPMRHGGGPTANCTGGWI